jgi:hypothetical protein
MHTETWIAQIFVKNKINHDWGRGRPGRLIFVLSWCLGVFTIESEVYKKLGRKKKKKQSRSNRFRHCKAHSVQSLFPYEDRRNPSR